MSIELEPSWLKILSSEFGQDYFIKLNQFLETEKQAGRIFFPPEPEIFNALNITPWDKVKVVIIGQDPYHGPGQAHGLAFSVREDKPIPPSLRKIYNELEKDIKSFEKPPHGNLTAWARQGVLLLNSILTVQSANPGSHQNKGWECFTDKIIKEISAQKQGVIFLLWGKFARAKANLIDHEKHIILTAAHPASRASAFNGFFGCQHFSKTNDLLISIGKTPVNWQIL